MAKTELQLLDELDEARHELRAYRRGWRLIVLAWLLLLAMFAIGILIGAWGAIHGFDTGGQAAAFSVSGMIGAVGTTIVGGCWFHWHNKLVVADRDGRKYNVRRSPASRVLAAERAHRNHILEQG